MTKDFFNNLTDEELEYLMQLVEHMGFPVILKYLDSLLMNEAIGFAKRDLSSNPLSALVDQGKGKGIDLVGTYLKELKVKCKHEIERRVEKPRLHSQP